MTGIDLHPSAIRILVALVRVHARNGRATVRELVEPSGLRSTHSVHRHLETLREQGFVAWEDGCARGTLRPLVREVAA